MRLALCNNFKSYVNIVLFPSGRYSDKEAHN